MAGGLKEVRERIGSVQNTMQITSAMKMVSAAKLRRAQDAITQMRPYAEKIQTIPGIHGGHSKIEIPLRNPPAAIAAQNSARRLKILAPLHAIFGVPHELRGWRSGEGGYDCE